MGQCLISCNSGIMLIEWRVDVPGEAYIRAGDRTDVPVGFDRVEWTHWLPGKPADTNAIFDHRRKAWFVLRQTVQKRISHVHDISLDTKYFRKVSYHGIVLSDFQWPVSGGGGDQLMAAATMAGLSSYWERERLIQAGVHPLKLAKDVLERPEKEWEQVAAYLRSQGWMVDNRDRIARGTIAVTACELTEGPIPLELVKFLGHV
jgi:hypothetical protein